MAVIAVHDEQFQQHIESGRPIIVKYYADWCGSCKLFAPKFTRLSNDERFQSVEFLEVNAEISPVARQSAGVDNLPFFAIFKDGSLVEGTATAKEDTVVAMLQKVSA
jgi:thiol-disulfide isomerase/thioredoxin